MVCPALVELAHPSMRFLLVFQCLRSSNSKEYHIIDSQREDKISNCVNCHTCSLKYYKWWKVENQQFLINIYKSKKSDSKDINLPHKWDYDSHQSAQSAVF